MLAFPEFKFEVQGPAALDAARLFVSISVI
jgi:hypothetical protein